MASLDIIVVALTLIIQATAQAEIIVSTAVVAAIQVLTAIIPEIITTEMLRETGQSKEAKAELTLSQ